MISIISPDAYGAVVISRVNHGEATVRRGSGMERPGQPGGKTMQSCNVFVLGALSGPVGLDRR